MNLIPSLICSAALIASAPATPPPAPFEADAHAGHKHHLNDPSDLTPEQRESQAYAKRLTEKQLEQFAVYEREMLLGDARQALAKAKMTRSQVEHIEGFVRQYYLARQGALRQRRQLAAAQERIAKARASGTEPAAADLDQERVLMHRAEEHETWRRKWTTTYGEKVRALLDKHESELVGLLDEADARVEKQEAENKAAAAKALDEELVNRYLAFLRAAPPPEGPRRAKALASAQIDEKTVHGVGLLATEYYRHKLEADQDTNNLADARRRLAQARAAKKQAGFEERLEKYYVDKLAKWATFRGEFATRYGEQAPALFDRFLPEISKALTLAPQLPAGFTPKAKPAEASSPSPKPSPAPATAPKP